MSFCYVTGYDEVNTQLYQILKAATVTSKLNTRLKNIGYSDKKNMCVVLNDKQQWQ